MKAFFRDTLVLAVFISALVHFSAWLGLSFSKKDTQHDKKSTVEIVILDSSDKKKMQFVEQPDKALNDEIPEDAKYLSKNNQRVVKETRAQHNGDFQNTAGRGGEKINHSLSAAKQTSAPKNKRGTLPTLADLRPKFDPADFLPKTPATNNNNNAGSGPTSQTNDHLKDTPSNLETLLNTREFVYYTYYQRIRSQIRQYWEPSIREKVKKIFASGRSIASEKDHITRVIIVLDKAGNLKAVQIVGQSGLHDLDEAAVEAFRAAEPFPNPPKGIVESDGTIRINWDFILEAHNFGPQNAQRYAKRP